MSKADTNYIVLYPHATPYPMKGIRSPGEHDLLLGRGGEINNHSGNVFFRNLVTQYKPKYAAASRIDKPKVSAELVQSWRKLSPPGRFLQRCNPGEADGVWEDIGDLAAKKRASKALGERDYKSKGKKASSSSSSATSEPRSFMRDESARLFGNHQTARQTHDAAGTMQPVPTASRYLQALSGGVENTETADSKMFGDVVDRLMTSANTGSASGTATCSSATSCTGSSATSYSSENRRQPTQLSAAPAAVCTSPPGADASSIQQQLAHYVELLVQETPIVQSSRDASPASAALHWQLQQQVFNRLLQSSNEGKQHPSVDPTSIPTAASLTSNAFSSGSSSGEEEGENDYIG